VINSETSTGTDLAVKELNGIGITKYKFFD
jgi:hypothetical protein